MGVVGVVVMTLLPSPRRRLSKWVVELVMVVVVVDWEFDGTAFWLWR